MILAAGLGTRLRPLTEHIPKPLVTVLGRSPLENAIINLKGIGIREIGINTHHLAYRIENFVSSLPDSGGLVLFHEPRILGTGGALINARDFLSGTGFFILHNADVLTDMDLESLCSHHNKSNATATLVLTDYAPENKVLCAPNGSVLDIAQSIGGSGKRLTYTGIAAFSPGIFDFLPEKGPASLIKALLKAVKERPGSVRAVMPEKLYWNDLGTLRRYCGAHEDILIKRVFSLRDMRIPGGPVFAAGGARISDKARLKGFVSVGSGCRVEDGAELEDCVLMAGAVARKGQSYRQAVMGRNFCISTEAPEVRNLAIVRRRSFGPGLTAAPLVEQGSDRQFFRLSDGSQSVVLMTCAPDDPDFGRYVEIGHFLYERGLGVPEILAVDVASHCVLLEDLGDDTLYLKAGQERDPQVLEGLYSGVIDLLADLNARATRELSACPAAAGRALDYDQLRWETDYFRENFLQRLLGFDKDRTSGLDEEFIRLARTVASHPRVFIHRDFQSQNILIKNGQARIVDFQGARLGPAAYDLASLLKDSYVVLPAAVRQRLAKRYRRSAARAGGISMSQTDLAEFLVTAGLQRNMQALGAFCFLWLVKGKPQFGKFIRPGLNHLEEGLSELNETGIPPGPLPGLTAIVAEARLKINSDPRIPQK